MESYWMGATQFCSAAGSSLFHPVDSGPILKGVLFVVIHLVYIQPYPYLGGVKPYRGGFCSFCNMVMVLFLPLGSPILAFFRGESSYGGGHKFDRGGLLLQEGSQLLWKVPLFILSFGGWLCLGISSSVGKLYGLGPKCSDAAVPFHVIYLLLWFVLLEGDIPIMGLGVLVITHQRNIQWPMMGNVCDRFWQWS